MYTQIFLRWPDSDDSGDAATADTATETDDSGFSLDESPLFDDGSQTESTPTGGADNRICITVTNNGSKKTGSFNVDYKLTDDRGADQRQIDVHPDGLEPGQSVNSCTPLPFLIVKGYTYTLTICVFPSMDPDHAIVCTQPQTITP